MSTYRQFLAFRGTIILEVIFLRAFHEKRQYDNDFHFWQSSYYDIIFTAHWHREVELLYVKAGEFTISVNNETFLATEGDLVICNSGDIHYCNCNGSENILDIIVFDVDVINPFYKNSRFLLPHITKSVLVESGIDKIVSSLFSIAKNELMFKKPHYKTIIKGRLLEFWAICLRHFQIAPKDAKKDNRRLAMLADLQELLDYIDSNYALDISLEQAAGKLNFSSWHFSKMFARLTGMNYVRYLSTIRVEKAIELIAGSPLTITDIALQCGFNNTRTFNRVFKDISGMTPSQLAKSDYQLPKKSSATKLPYIQSTIISYTKTVE